MISGAPDANIWGKEGKERGTAYTEGLSELTLLENLHVEIKRLWTVKDKGHGRRGNRNKSFSLEKFSNEKRTETVAGYLKFPSFKIFKDTAWAIYNPD